MKKMYYNLSYVSLVKVAQVEEENATSITYFKTMESSIKKDSKLAW